LQKKAAIDGMVWGEKSQSTHYRSLRGRFYEPDDSTNIAFALKDIG